MSSLSRRPAQESTVEQRPEEAPPETQVTEEGPEAEEVEACFDTPGHILVGDGVPGAPVEINRVVFTPGELAALVDYVGDLAYLYQLEQPHLEAIQAELKEPGEPDTKRWDELTEGRYSKLSMENEDHFAPGAGGGPDFRSSFVSRFAAAFVMAQRANLELDEGSQEHEQAMAEARLHLYGAEHYLQDAFSAGHQVSAGDIDARLDALLDEKWIAPLVPAIADEVVAAEGDRLSRYALRATPSDPIDSGAEFAPVLGGALAWFGRDGIKDSVRFAIHERLEVGVEVSSPAHPCPWVLTGDHDVAENPETLAALEVALGEVRTALEVQAVPGVDPERVATELFDRHCPVPTDDGQAVIDLLLDQATRSTLGLASALADAATGQIEAVIQGAVDRWVLVPYTPPGGGEDWRRPAYARPYD